MSTSNKRFRAQDVDLEKVKGDLPYNVSWGKSANGKLQSVTTKIPGLDERLSTKLNHLMELKKRHNNKGVIYDVVFTADHATVYFGSCYRGKRLPLLLAKSAAKIFEDLALQIIKNFHEFQKVILSRDDLELVYSDVHAFAKKLRKIDKWIHNQVYLIRSVSRSLNHYEVVVHEERSKEKKKERELARLHSSISPKW